MAYSYKAPQREQAYLLPPSIGDWLPEGHLVWFVLDVVAMIDLAEFHERHDNAGPGRRAYDPEMMLALLFYAYCTGVRSSRRIEAAVRTDVAFKAICCDLIPDHIAIARFRANHQQAIGDAFVDVLRLCAKAGLASLGTVAIDGTKIGSDAALDANRTESAIRAEVDRILSEASASDTTEDAQPTLGGDLPALLSRRSGRLGRLKAALDEIEAERQQDNEAKAAQDARWAQDAEQGHRPRGAKSKDPERQVARAEADLAAATAREQGATSTLAKLQAAQGLTDARASLDQARAAAEAAPAPPEPQANTTDPESRIMKDHGGWIQGFNAQAGVNEHQVVVGALVTNAGNDVNQLLPMIDVVNANAQLVGIDTQDQRVLADAGYWSEDNATAPGPDRLIATTKDWKQRKAAREMGTTTGAPPPGASVLEQMEHRLRTQEGAAAYARRSFTVEPKFGDVKENLGFRRFMRRGIEAAASEWALICATGNVMKLFTHAGGRNLAEIITPAI